MVKKTYKEKLLDPRWQKKRLEILSSDNFTCQWCGENEKTLHVHHFYYNKSMNPWEYAVGDLITLCSDCHYFEHLQGVPNIITDLHSMLSINTEKYGYAMKLLVELSIKYYK